MTYTVEWLLLENLSAAQLAGWTELAAANAPHLPMLQPFWVKAYAEVLLAVDKVLWVGIAQEQDVVVAILPLVLLADSRSRWTPQRVETLYHEHSSHGDLLLRQGTPCAVVSELFDTLCEKANGGLAEVACRGIGSDSPLVHDSRALSQGYRVDFQPRNLGSYLPLTSTAEAYFGSLSKNFRSGLKKSANRLVKDGLGAAQSRWISKSTNPAENLDRFLQLEQAGWKGEAGTAIAQNPQLSEFYAALVERSHQQGVLEWHCLELGDRLVACHMAFRIGSKMTLLKIAYDESFARYSPGNLLFKALVERCYTDSQLDEINCLTDMPWHRRWDMSSREFADLRVYPKQLTASLFGLLPRKALNATKSLIKTRKEPGVAGNKQ